MADPPAWFDACRHAFYRSPKAFAADVPSAVLCHPQYHFAVSKRVGGVSLDPLDEPGDRFRNIAAWTLAPP